MVVTDGASCLWNCAHCGAVFEIKLRFTVIDPERMVRVRETYGEDDDTNESRDCGGEDEDVQRLLEVFGEIVFLRDRLASLEEEAERLKDEIDP